ncbi:bifunctional diguanylate cyclase/phosphodiesterase [Solimonas fluminis]|uniref:cyclic-guanylate-specific phosphodiesterase n=1 Tax=Solimonas fluminis TaxID=2086571 RepID=A0A2S5TI01_9GAMM|nr:EAL domain-containing protein [Solimonas fluminis]PPE74610.1 bifunctional diguanylate cyclase/phosphodiesterase [Solimonas fluminis]
MPDPALAASISAAKGLLFAVVTAALLFFGFRRQAEPEAGPARSALPMPPLLASVLLLAVLVCVISAIAYREQRSLLMQDVGADLGTETQLKAERIATLYASRQMQAAGAGADPLMAELLQRWLRRPDAADRQRLRDWLASVRDRLQLREVRLHDPAGRPLLNQDGPLSGAAEETARLAAAHGRIELEDLHRDRPGDPLHLALAVPIPGGRPGQALAVLMLEDADETELFSIVARRISESRSGETYLVRSDRGRVQFLTPLRQRPQAVLERTMPGAESRVPDMLMGRHGQVQRGRDYRGVVVLAQAEPIAGTPWVLVTQVDEAEALAGLQRVAWLFGGLLLVATTLSLLLLQQQLQRGRLRTALAELRQTQALEDSEQRFREAFENASIGMMISTIEGRLLRVNAMMCRMTGYSAEELMEKGFVGITHPDDLDETRRQRDAVAAGLQVGTYEKRYLRKDGSELWVAVNPSLVRDAQGRPLYLFGAIRDVTERRRAEEAHRQSEERFELAMRGAHHGVWDWNLDDGRVYYSGGWKAMLGYGEDELDGNIATYEGLLHPEDLPRLREAVQDIRDGKARSLELDFRMRHKHGAYIHIQSQGFPVYGAGGRLQRLVGTHVNISERKAIELALRERLTLQQYISRVAGTLPGALFAFRRLQDGSYRMPYVSPPFEALFGVTAEQVANDMTAVFARVLPEDLQGLIDSIEQACSAGTPWHREMRIHAQDGKILWLEGRSMPEADPDGGVTWHGFLHDVTERKAQELQLRQAATVFTGTHEGVVITDPEGQILAVNPAFCAITGYGEPELIGQNMRLLKSGRQDAAFYAKVWDAIRSQGFWQGEMWNRRKNGEIFPEWQTISAVHDAAGKLVNYVGSFSDISRIKQSEAQLEHLAHHDALTGLPNRLVLRSKLDEALVRGRRSGHSGALLMMDLDRFKNVNDSLGHAAGDELLTFAAQRLRAALRESDLLVRQGGDEFVVLLEGLGQAEDAARVARSLIECIGQPFLLSGGHQAYVGLSIGISLFPADGDSAGDVIKHADSALYEAKAAGRGTYRFYNASLTQVAASRLELEARLRRALEREEFTLHYQPLVNLANGRLRGVEALVRWQDGEGRTVPPGEFIPLAEDTGLIVPLGEWVLRQACTQVARWRSEGFELGTLAVNLSPRQLGLPDIDDRVRAILAETGLPPQVLELEITEGALAGDTAHVQDKVSRLKALGLRIAIDDFGTGYSSLVYLKRFPVDKLKIDRAFVRDVPEDATDAEIISAIIALGTILQLEVLAEGVEKPSQLQFLLQHGCNSGQGFLFSRPVPPDQIRTMDLEPLPRAA